MSPIISASARARSQLIRLGRIVTANGTRGRQLGAEQFGPARGNLGPASERDPRAQISARHSRPPAQVSYGARRPRLPARLGPQSARPPARRSSRNRNTGAQHNSPDDRHLYRRPAKQDANQTLGRPMAPSETVASFGRLFVCALIWRRIRNTSIGGRVCIKRNQSAPRDVRASAATQAALRRVFWRVFVRTREPIWSADWAA